MSEEAITLSQIGAFVPFPSDLLDEQMPQLKDTEWRLLCVVVRQTLGWQDGMGKGRKRRDWLSQKQLMARTGRNSAALSAAIDVLVRKNLIECCNAQGEPLATPQQRRRHRGRVYFALAKSRLTGAAPTVTLKRSSEDIRAAYPEVSTPRIYSGWASAGKIAEQLDYPNKSEVQKSNWTKET
jgi:hypothetical protein